MVGLTDLRSRVEVIRGQEADRLRVAYIDRFVNTGSETYRQRIQERGPQGDEQHYTAYLWDTLKHAEVISEEQILDDLSDWDKVFVFWDLHSERKILIPNYWKFPKDAVLLVASADLIEGLVQDSEAGSPEDWLLPEDLYIFDEAMSSSLVTTHEYVPERYCLRAT